MHVWRLAMMGLIVAAPVAAETNPTPLGIPDAPPVETEATEAAAPLEPLTLPQAVFEVQVSTSQGLSLEEALEIAIANNPELAQARLAITSSEFSLQGARAEFWPTLSQSASYSYVQSPSPALTTMLPDGRTQIRTNEARTFSMSPLELNYTITDGGARLARNRIAERNLDIAQSRLSQTEQSIKLQTAEAYYLLQRADALVETAVAAVANSEASLRDAEAAERAGTGTRFSVLQVETELASNQVGLLRAQNEQQVARRTLATLLNFAVPTDVSATDPIIPNGAWELSLEQTILEAFERRPELAILREQVANNYDQAQVSLAATRPRLNAFATYDLRNEFLNTNANGTFDGYSVGLRFNWLLFDAQAAQSQARVNDITAEQTILEFDNTRNTIRRSVEESFLTLLSSREQIQAALVGFETATESLRLARLRFQAGVGTQTDVIAQETALTRARIDVDAAVIQYNLSLVRLQRAINAL